jgi:hypothetical protein
VISLAAFAIELNLLRDALGSRDGVDIRWKRR